MNPMLPALEDFDRLDAEIIYSQTGDGIIMRSVRDADRVCSREGTFPVGAALITKAILTGGPVVEGHIAGIWYGDHTNAQTVIADTIGLKF